LCGIFRPRLRASLTRLSALKEIEAFDDSLVPHRLAYERLVDKLTRLEATLEEHVFIHRDWRQVEFGLKEIGKISFKQLRKRYAAVLADVARVYNTGYFDCFN
jgi:hypothetical protein